MSYRFTDNFLSDAEKSDCCGDLAKAVNQPRDKNGRFASTSNHLPMNEAVASAADGDYRNLIDTADDFTTESVRISDLQTIQDSVMSSTVDIYTADIKAGKPIAPITATRVGGKTIVLNGNHRVVAASQAGIDTVEARIYPYRGASKFDDGDLAKAGVGDDYTPETAPPPEGTYVDPERDAGRKAEREMRMAFTRHLRSMGRKVSNQAAELLREKGLAKADPSEEDVDAIINSLSTITFADMQGDITEILQSIYASAGTEALGQIGVEVTDDLVNVVNQSAVSWAERHAADLVGVSKNPVYALTDSTRDMLRSTITKGLRDNLSAEGIAKEIMSSHAFSADRAEIIAMTEIRHANSMGAVEGYKEAEDLGIKVKKRWYNMEAACSICTANGAAGAIDLSENFPSGNGSPPGHPNCRCVIVPEVEE